MVHSTWGIIIAGGKSEQISTEVATPFLYLNNNPIIVYSLQAYERCPDIDGVIVLVDKERIESVTGMVQMFGCSKVKKIHAIGAHRQVSILNELKEMDDEVTLVSLHDVARPFVTSELISETVKAAKRHGSGVAAVQITDSVKLIGKGMLVGKSLHDEQLWIAQTPQTYARAALQKACVALAKKKTPVEDDSVAVAGVKQAIHLVPAKKNNIKIRTPEDLTMAIAMAKL